MLSDKLPILQWGPRKLRAWAGQLCDVSDARQPVSDDGSIQITERVDGRGLSVAKWVYGRIANSGIGGFKCVAAGSKVRVYFGTVNNVKPTEMTLGDVTPCLITATGSSGVICLRVTVSNDGTGGDADHIADGSIVSASIRRFATAPPDAEPLFYLMLGSYGLSGGALTVTPGGQGNGVGDQQFELCGGLGGDPKWGPA